MSSSGKQARFQPSSPRVLSGTKAAIVLFRITVALCAGAVAFVLASSLFTFVMVGFYDKDAASVRFAVLRGVVGFPACALIALLTAYFVFAKNKGHGRC